MCSGRWCNTYSVINRGTYSPAIAGGAVLCGTIGSMLSPGMSHNAFVANMANMEVVDLIARHSPYSLMAGAIGSCFTRCCRFSEKSLKSLL